MNASLATQPTIWSDATAEAQVGDVIYKPFCPIARVISKEILADGRIGLIVAFPGCGDRRTEEWVLPAVEVISTPVVVATPEPVVPTATETDNLPRVSIAKIDKKLDAIFGERVKQYQQFLIIREELTAIGIKVGKLIKSHDDAKGWNLSWNGDKAKAGLFWSAGGDWCVESLKYDTELIGQWEGFDLIEHLECNGIDLDPSDED